MAPTSSSTKKAARLAQKGKGQKVRFQGGALFPVAVALIFVLGFALVVYARESRPAADASAPTIDDHWHHAYGFYLCDQWVELSGDGEDQDANGRPTNTKYARSGIHSHDDGLIHWHPFSSASIGRRAQLGVFLDVYDVELGDDTLQFPDDQRAQLPVAFQETGLFENGETSCEITDADGNVTTEDAQLSVTIWNNITDTDDGTTFIAGFDQIRLDMDAMAISIAFTADGTTVDKPPSTAGFEANSLNDQAQQDAVDLFPGVERDEDGNITIDSVPAEDAETGPAVDTETDEPVTTEAAEEPPTSDSETE